jgi:rubrerythrin
MALIESGRSEASEQAGDGMTTFIAAGSAASGEFRCAECGYGAVVRSRLPECPMCHGLSWEAPEGSSSGLTAV